MSEELIALDRIFQLLKNDVRGLDLLESIFQQATECIRCIRRRKVPGCLNGVSYATKILREHLQKKYGVIIEGKDTDIGLELFQRLLKERRP